MLEWARESAGYSLDDAAEKLGINVAKLGAVEAGEDDLSFAQLQKCANAYGRPLAALFIATPPPPRQTLTDFRLHEGSRSRLFSPQINLIIRRAERLREDAIQLASEVDSELHEFSETVSFADSPDETAERILRMLRITPDIRRTWRTTEIALKGWKYSIESLGIMVLEVSRVSSDDMRGMCIPNALLPIIVVNGGESSAARCFTLLHELTHVLLRQSAVCDFNVSGGESPEARVEVFCNAVAGSALVPSRGLLNHVGHVARHDWTHAELFEIAQLFCVSKEVILRRLLALGRTSQTHYARMRAEFVAEYRRNKERKREAAKANPVKISPAVMAVRNLGYPFVHLVMDAYHRDRIGLATVSDYLGIKVKHLDRIETLIRNERLAA